MEEELKIFGQRLKELREEKGYTQIQLALMIGKNAKSTISQYEGAEREPGLKIIKQFAEIFNVSIGYLIGESDERGFYNGQKNKKP